MKTRSNPALIAGRALVAALVLSSAILPTGASIAAEAAAPSPAPGVWQKHQYLRVPGLHHDVLLRRVCR